MNMPQAWPHRKAVLSTIRIGLLLICTAGLMPADAAADGPPLDNRPNILLIVADDLGFSDLGAFGGEIDTPALDTLARQGIRLTGFYASPSCSPTRAMLLTGEDNHRVGLGSMAEVLAPSQRGQPGYEGYLNGATTIAGYLQQAGYATLMTGKWHLGDQAGQSPADHGFDRSFVLLGGGANHFGLDQGGPWAGSRLEAKYQRDGKPAIFPEGAYSTDYFTDQMIAFLRKPIRNHQPFFAYLAFTAPHWPLQAPAELIAKYQGRYDAGPIELRKKRFARMKALGLLPETVTAAPTQDNSRWADMSKEEQVLSVQTMAIYAAMVERMDQNIGKILHELRQAEVMDKTIIIFLSDNGAEGLDQNQLENLLHRLGATPPVLTSIRAANADPNRRGGSDSYLAYGPEWAQAATLPSRMYKGFTYEGGIRTPAFIYGPGVVGSRIIDAPLSVRDILPTILDLAGMKPPLSIGSRSWLPLLQNSVQSIRSAQDVIAWELFFRRAIRRDTWKAVFDGTGNNAIMGEPGQFHWQLFDLAHDPGETNDLAKTRPDILNSLIEDWNAYATRNGIVLPP